MFRKSLHLERISLKEIWQMMPVEEEKILWIEIYIIISNIKASFPIDDQ